MTDKPTILITGNGPTYPLYQPLSKHFNVAVYSKDIAQQLTAEIGTPVMCPSMGAQAQLYEKAKNDAALLASQVVNNLDRLSFSLNGVQPKALADWSTWAPGTAVGHFADIAATLRVLDAFAKANPVSGVITHEDVTPQFRTLALWAKARQIPLVHLPHANCFSQTRPDIHDTSYADWILAASSHMREWYVERGYPADQIRVVGFPPWDKWYGLDDDQSLARRILLLENDKPVIAFCTGWPQRTNFVDDHTLLDRAAHAMMMATKEAGWQLVWKLHPGDAPNREQQCAAYAAALRVPALITRDHLAVVLQAADAVVSTGPSNVLVETGLVGRVPAIIDIRGYGFMGEPPFRVALNSVNSIENLIDKEWDRDAFVRRYAYRDDGRATKRAIKWIRRVIDARV